VIKHTISACQFWSTTSSGACVQRVVPCAGVDLREFLLWMLQYRFSGDLKAWRRRAATAFRIAERRAGGCVTSDPQVPIPRLRSRRSTARARQPQ